MVNGFCDTVIVSDINMSESLKKYKLEFLIEAKTTMRADDKGLVRFKFAKGSYLLNVGSAVYFFEGHIMAKGFITKLYQS